jgi:hypothetical protein
MRILRGPAPRSIEECGSGVPPSSPLFARTGTVLEPAAVDVCATGSVNPGKFSQIQVNSGKFNQFEKKLELSA